MNLPRKFLENLQISSSDLNDFQDSLREPPPVSVRVNPAKAKIAQESEKVEWCANAFYLSNRPRYTSDPAFHAGAYYPQEASSMFVDFMVRTLLESESFEKALDLCAAPGGKSTLLRSALPDNCLLHSNEVIRSRTGRLIENLTKWGDPSILVTNNDPKEFVALENFYDLILVDAPCSGEGLFRKQPEAINQWSEQSVELCSSRQKRILSDIWPSLKKGGILIYSTCTYNADENEENLKWLSDQNNLEFINIDSSTFPGIIVSDESIMGYRFMPHLIRGEGFFCSVVRKLDGDTKDPKIKLSNNFRKLKADLKQGVLIENKFGDVYQCREDHVNFINQISSSLNCISPGIQVSKSVKGKLKYQHGNTQIAQNVFDNLISLELDDALRFLSKNDLAIVSEKGEQIMHFDGFNLGYGKSDGRRIISQYPKNWRVLLPKTGRVSKNSSWNLIIRPDSFQ